MEDLPQLPVLLIISTFNFRELKCFELGVANTTLAWQNRSARRGGASQSSRVTNMKRAYGAHVLAPPFASSSLLFSSFLLSWLISKCARLWRALVPPPVKRAPSLRATPLPLPSLLLPFPPRPSPSFLMHHNRARCAHPPRLSVGLCARLRRRATSFSPFPPFPPFPPLPPLLPSFPSLPSPPTLLRLPFDPCNP